MSCFMAWNPVLPQLIDWSSLELGNVHLGAVLSSTTTVAGCLCVTSSCRCLLKGDLHLGLLEPFQVPSPSIVLSRDVFRGPAFEVDFLTLFTWEKHRTQEHPEPRPGNHTLAGTPADFLFHTGFPARAGIWENQEGGSHPRSLSML